MARSCSGWSTSNYFYRASAPATNEPLSFACWYRANALTATMVLMALSNEATANGTFSLRVLGASANDPLTARKADDAGVTGANATVNTDSTTGVWRFAGCVFASDTSRTVYFGNAGTVTSGTDTTSVTDPTADNTTIGAQRNSTVIVPFSGDLALPTIWTAALSVDEMTGMARGMHPARFRPSSISRAYWMPTAGSRLVDFSGNQAALSLVGSVTDNAFGPPVEPYIYGYGWPRNAPLIEEAAGGWGPLLGQRRNRLVA